MSGPFVEGPVGDHEVDPVVAERPAALLRRVDDRLLVDVEGGVDQHRQAGLCLEALEDVVVERILLASHDLGACRAVDMDDGRDALAPLRA